MITADGTFLEDHLDLWAPTPHELVVQCSHHPIQGEDPSRDEVHPQEHLDTEVLRHDVLGQDLERFGDLAKDLQPDVQRVGRQRLPPRDRGDVAPACPSGRCTRANR